MSCQESRKGVQEDLRGKVLEIEALNREMVRASDRHRSAEAGLRLSLTRQEATVSKARMDLSAAEEQVSRLTDDLAQRNDAAPAESPLSAPPRADTCVQARRSSSG